MNNLMSMEKLSLIANSQIQWLKIIQNIFPGSSVKNYTLVIVKEVDYIKKLQKTNKRVIANYIQWRYVMALTDDSIKLLREAKSLNTEAAN